MCDARAARSIDQNKVTRETDSKNVQTVTVLSRGRPATHNADCVRWTGPPRTSLHRPNVQKKNPRFHPLQYHPSTQGVYRRRGRDPRASIFKGPDSPEHFRSLLPMVASLGQLCDVTGRLVHPARGKCTRDLGQPPLRASDGAAPVLASDGTA
eukprot:scaffold10172_cov71-Phaeocystis_antarctica.AAC.1